jgi:hypothetical protein
MGLRTYAVKDARAFHCALDLDAALSDFSVSAFQLVDVWFREFEGVFQYLDLRLLWGDDHFNDVEPEQDFRVMQKAKPGEGTARNQFLFRFVHGVRRVAKFARGTSFDFDKDQCCAVAADDIDFAATRRAVVSIEHFVSVAPEMPGGEIFTAPSEHEVRREVRRS